MFKSNTHGSSQCGEISFVGVCKTKTPNKLKKLVSSEWRCMECKERVSKMCKKVGKSGVFLCRNCEGRSEVQSKMYEEILKYYNENKDVRKWGLSIVYDDFYKMISGCLKDGEDVVEEYYHYSYTVSSKTCNDKGLSYSDWKKCVERINWHLTSM